MTVFLCGFMGCGKTTIGKILAEKLKTEYIDTDEYIVSETGMTIPQIFEKMGEPYFRKTESGVIRELCGKNAVIACGGGAMINRENAETAAEHGVTVFLDVPFSVCLSRIKDDENRPIVKNNSLNQLEKIYDSRYNIYKENSVLCVNADTSPENAAEIIKNAVISYYEKGVLLSDENI